jgi:uncharacterized membrane protein HdeD (DUF308 family)
MSTKLFKNWWLMMVKALLSVVIGLLIIIDPHAMASSLMTVFAILLGIGGLSLMAGAVSHRIINSEWTWWLLEGMIDILICVLIIIRPLEAANFLCIVAGLWLSLMGIIHLVTAINFQYYISGNKIFIVSSVFLLISGLLFLIIPATGLKMLMLLTGICIICYGVLQVYISFVLKNVSIEEIGEIEDLY